MGDFDTELAHDDFGLDARTIDFTTGQTNLTPVTAKPLTSLTGAQLARDVQSARAETLSQQAQQSAQLKQTGGYNAARAADVAANQDFQDRIREIKGIGKVGAVDWGLIPLGAAILTTGAAVIASGGALAGALAAPLSVGAAGATATAIGTATAADKLLATVQQGGDVAKKAAAVIDNTKKLAASGNTDAKQALGIVEQVASDRLAKAIPPGIAQPLSDIGKLASETVPVVVAVKGDVTDLVKAVGGASAAVKASGKAPAPAAALPPTPALDATLSAAGQPSAAVARSSSLTRIAPAPALPPFTASARPRWVVTDQGVVLLALTQPASAPGRYLVYDDGRVIHQ